MSDFTENSKTPSMNRFWRLQEQHLPQSEAIRQSGLHPWYAAAGWYIEILGAKKVSRVLLLARNAGLYQPDQRYPAVQPLWWVASLQPRKSIVPTRYWADLPLCRQWCTQNASACGMHSWIQAPQHHRSGRSQRLLTLFSPSPPKKIIVKTPNFTHEIWRFLL